MDEAGVRGMRTIYVREYTWGIGPLVFETRKDAEDFDSMQDELIRVVEFREVV